MPLASLPYVTQMAWLEDGGEDSLRSAMAVCVPELAHLPVKMTPSHEASNPLWWSSTAVVAERFIVKFAWSEVRAVRLWREGMLLERLRAYDPALALPEVVALSRSPALLVTRRLTGEPLSWDWASSLAGEKMTEVANKIAAFLVRLHGVDARPVVGDLPAVVPTAQADTETLRRRFPLLVDDERAAWVLRRCDWVDDVLGADSADPGVLVHGDLHGYNQLWDRVSASLVAVVDFEESGVADRHFDLRYLPGNSAGRSWSSP